MDKQQAKHILKNTGYIGNEVGVAFDVAVKSMDKLERIEQIIEERKVGKWLSAEEYALKIGAEVTEDIKNSLYKFCPFCDQTVFMEHNYCPNCGAEMRGVARMNEYRQKAINHLKTHLGCVGYRDYLIAELDKLEKIEEIIDDYDLEAWVILEKIKEVLGNE